MNKDYIVLYSTNTYLAYHINETYYNGKHFVWCGSAFDPTRLASTDLRSRIPPSSSPYSIYQTLRSDIERNDLHSAKIRDNRKGLIRGSIIMYDKGVIDANTQVKIEKIVTEASLQEFGPLLYVIPIINGIKKRIVTVDIDSKANPLSEEYQIVDLAKKEFDIIQF